MWESTIQPKQHPRKTTGSQTLPPIGLEFKFTRVEYLLRLTRVDHALRVRKTQDMGGIVIGKQYCLPGDNKTTLNAFIEECLVVDRQG